MHYKAFIVDDEQKAIDALRWKLELVAPNVKITGEFTNPEKALLKCISQKVDLVFLDIEMPEMNGLEFITELKNLNHIPDVIFVSGHEDFVLEALRNEAFDYIYKPIDPDDLKQAILRFEKEMSNKIEHSNYNYNKVALPTSERIIYIEKDQILYCESDSNYTIFHTKEGEKHIIAKTLGKVELILGDQFQRIHNSYIINMKKITSYQRGTGGSVILEDGVLIPVSKNRKEELMARLHSEF